MTASNETSIIIRNIEEISEMRAAEDLQIKTWGEDERDIVPLTQLAAARHVGGSLIGAFDGGTLAGFVYGFYGHVGGRIVHHSHMLAVHPEYRNRELAFRLKLAQREHVISGGIADQITWTFDPLQSINAYLNFAKLGVISDTYKVNIYGDLGTSFLHRNGTDRLFVTWFVKSPHVINRIERRSTATESKDESFPDAITLIRHSGSGVPERISSDADIGGAKSAFVEIPTNIRSIEKSDFSMAERWRAETRKVFVGTLNAGFVVTDFHRKDKRTGMYLLEKGGRTITQINNQLGNTVCEEPLEN